MSCNMGHVRSDRTGNEPFYRLASRRPLAMQPVATKARSRSGFFLPRLEMLEDRIYPGDTLLGIWALGLWGSSFACQDGASASSRAPYGEWQHGHTNLDGADAFSAILLLSDSHREGDRGGSVGDRAAVTAALETSAAADTPLFADDNLA